MPKIPVYETGVSPLASLPGQNPDRVYADGRDFQNRGLDYVGMGLMDAGERLYDAEQRQEVGDVNAKMATLRGQLTTEFMEGAAQNADDPEYTSKFMQDATNRIQTMAGQVNTKAGQAAFQRDSANLTASMLTMATEHKIAVAGAKSVANYQSMVNQNAGTLFNDPSQFESIERTVTGAFSDPDGPYANVPAEQRAKLQNNALEQLSIAAGRGAAMSNPDLAEKMYKAGSLPGQKYLTESGNAQIVGYISTMQNAARTKAALAIAQEERAKRLADENAAQSMVSYLVKNPNSPEAVDKIMHSAMSPEHKLSFLALAGHSLAEKAHDQNSYGAGFYDTYQKIQSGEIRSMQDLTKQVGPNGSLTLAGVNTLANELVGKRTPEGQIEADMKKGFIDAMGKQLSGRNEMLGVRDPKGEVLKQQALAWFLPAFEQAKQEGKYPPSVLLDPGSPHSLWQGVMRFKRSPNQYMADLMEGTTLGGPTRVTGDADYAKLPVGAQYIGPDGKQRTKK